MKKSEIELVSSLTNTPKNRIKLSNDGFLSRGYVINNGRIVFKFKKHPETSYKNEIEMLNIVNSLGLEVNLQKVGWISNDDSYLGLYGVKGETLESISLSDGQCESIGKQIGQFLKKLHSSENNSANLLKVEEEIKAWQERFDTSKGILEKYFNETELGKIEDFVKQTVPEKLKFLGEKYVFSHGDLGMGNIFVDENGKIGIIDFSESVYLDESADFMDFENDKLAEKS